MRMWPGSLNSSHRYESSQLNQSAVTHFILLGIPNTEGLHTILFVIFLIFYLSTLLGNMTIMMTVVSDFHLHTPMYFFLCKLALLDIGFSSISAPKMLAFLWTESRTISFGGCMAQVFFYHFVGCYECLLYTVMAYDRYVAICYPLRYLVIMNRKSCVIFAISISVMGSIQGIVFTSLTFTLPFCGPNQVDYFFCDILPVIKLACTDTTAIEALIFNNVGIVGMTCFFLILVSYVRIIYSIVHMSTREGRHKAASTCASHLLVVTFFFGPCALIYMQPSLSEILLVSVHVFGSIVTPMLNPAIYTLRNKEVKAALKKLMGAKLTPIQPRS